MINGDVGNVSSSSEQRSGRAKLTRGGSSQETNDLSTGTTTTATALMSTAGQMSNATKDSEMTSSEQQAPDDGKQVRGGCSKRNPVASPVGSVADNGAGRKGRARDDRCNANGAEFESSQIDSLVDNRRQLKKSSDGRERGESKRKSRERSSTSSNLIRRDDSWQSLVSLTRVGKAPMQGQ